MTPSLCGDKSQLTLLDRLLWATAPPPPAGLVVVVVVGSTVASLLLFRLPSGDHPPHLTLRFWRSVLSKHPSQKKRRRRRTDDIKSCFTKLKRLQIINKSSLFNQDKKLISETAQSVALA